MTSTRAARGTQRGAVLAVVLTSYLMIVLDISIVIPRGPARAYSDPALAYSPAVPSREGAPP